MSDLVKALEWHNFDAWTWWAEAVCGTYHVEERNGGWRVELRFHDARRIITETDGFDGAIVAAQSDYTARILPAVDTSAVDAMATENKRLREALISIDALDPEQQIDGFSVAAMRGLPLRMGEIARAALNEADNARLVEAEDGA